MIWIILIAAASGFVGGLAGGLVGGIVRARAAVAPQLHKRPRCVDYGCNAFGSPDCSDGRCRHHCKLNCECETDKPPVDALTAEAQKALGLRNP